MIKTFVRHKRSQQIHQLKKWRREGIKEFLNCALTFLFFTSMKLREFVLHNMRTIKW